MKNKKNEGEATAPTKEIISEASFEQSFAILETSADLLERGNLPLEESLKEYERGLMALGDCYAVLQRAQRRIEVLGKEVGAVQEGPGGIFWKPASANPALNEAVASVEQEVDRGIGKT